MTSSGISGPGAELILKVVNLLREAWETVPVGSGQQTAQALHLGLHLGVHYPEWALWVLENTGAVEVMRNLSEAIITDYPAGELEEEGVEDTHI